jgi:DMSO/TMAO reductase YedYZ molybdopterin-dependent catalytic subunit
MTHPEIVVTGAVGAERRISAAAMAAAADTVADAASVAAGAVGRAVRVAALLADAGPLRDATHCTVISSGGYRASIPLVDLTAGGWLAFSDGDGPLPEDKGGPFRLTVAQGSTLCWNVKQVAMLRLTAGPEPDDVPENPPH